MLTARQIVRWAGVGLSMAGVLFAILGYVGVWDHFRQIDALLAVATRFDHSYTPDAALPVHAGDPEWPAVIRVIRAYSPARNELPRDREPLIFVRAQAVTSAQNLQGEWTAPTTQITLSTKSGQRPVLVHLLEVRTFSSWARLAISMIGFDGIRLISIFCGSG
jgi:hypothetical protein